MPTPMGQTLNSCSHAGSSNRNCQPGCHDQTQSAAKRMMMSNQAARVIGALVEIRSMPVLA